MIYFSSFTPYVVHSTRPVDIAGMAGNVWQNWFEIGVALNIPISKLEQIHTNNQLHNTQAHFQVSYFNSFDGRCEYLLPFYCMVIIRP